MQEQRSLHELEDELIELAGHLNAAECRFLLRFEEFDRRDGWVGDGVRSAAHWLNWRCGLSLPAARERVRIAHALPGLPRIRDAFTAGELSYAKVRALTRVATAETEADLVHIALHATAEHVERLVREYRRVARLNDADAQARALASRVLRHRWDDDGMLVGSFRFPPEEGALFLKAVRYYMRLLDDNAAPAPDVPTTAGAWSTQPARPMDETPAAEEDHGVAGGTDAELAGNASAEGHGDDEQRWRQDFAWLAAQLDADDDDAEDVSAAASEPDVVAPAADGASTEAPHTDWTRRRSHLARRPPGWYLPGQPHPPSEPEAVELPPGDADDPLGARWADAMIAMATAALTIGELREPGNRTELVVYAHAPSVEDPDVGDGAFLADGPAIGWQTMRRLGCDAATVTMVLGADGTPIDVGRRTRRISKALRRALRARDGRCVFPGCTARHQLDAHHLRYWTEGGRTDLANLGLLCRYHHRLVHEGGYRMIAVAPGRFRFYRPDGTEVPETTTTQGSVDDLRADHAAAGLDLTAATVDSRWQGDRLDFDHAIAGLMASRVAS